MRLAPENGSFVHCVRPYVGLTPTFASASRQGAPIRALYSDLTLFKVFVTFLDSAMCNRPGIFVKGGRHWPILDSTAAPSPIGRNAVFPHVCGNRAAEARASGGGFPRADCPNSPAGANDQ